MNSFLVIIAMKSHLWKETGSSSVAGGPGSSTVTQKLVRCLTGLSKKGKENSGRAEKT